jgi:hypothetical protein
VTQFLDLFLLTAPWVALGGGLALAVLSVPGVRDVTPLRREPVRHVLPVLSAVLLGLSLAGLGATYLLTGGRTGYANIYLIWLALVTFSGLLGLAPGRN